MDTYETSKACVDAIPKEDVMYSRWYVGRAVLAPGFQDHELTPADGEQILWHVLQYLGLWHHIEAGDIIRHILHYEFRGGTFLLEQDKQKGGLTNG